MITDRCHHPLVKDLAWLVEGHYIERDFDLQPYWLDDVNERLLWLDKHPDAIVSALAACKSHFLGSYFETLFSFAIEQLSVLKIHLEHFQIESEGKTLGEVDMLVETPDGELHQFEIAIKFYLERPDLFPHDWIGPNKNDSLLKKVTRAREHQLIILQTSEGSAAIEAIAEGRNPQASLLIFGRLYVSLDSKDKVIEWLNQIEHGGWIRVSQVALLAPFFSDFFILQKPHWLSVPCISDNFPFNSLQYAYNLVGEFLFDSRPKHVLLKPTFNTTDQIYRNVFIVPDTW
ncbi:DUF1853 domain-containing protein [Marinomonas sp. CT5]|uniref:DUF1853 family protein n=1 Tax=Marinomonas sp. CT5 TaxID=2066133 RepID=UPI001BB0695B|nr:DUF1853 family protein [Marinomonas sp. CT5]QUX95476.1 DUF1853 domain-containing protein [Marinomonas sp. CT5]